MKKSPSIIILILLTSCSNFNGYVEERILSPSDSAKTIFLINKSTNKKYVFTIKETAITSEGKKIFNNSFYTLEPGQEVIIGQNFIYSDQQYKNEYRINSYDTLKEVVDYGTKIKLKPRKDFVSNIDFVYKTRYFKNNKEVDVFEYLAANSDGKLIDSTKKDKIEVRIYQSPVKVINRQIPLPRIKTTYKFEISGQVPSK